MSTYVLLTLLNPLGKKIRCEAVPSILSVSPTSLTNSIIKEHECKILFIIYHMTLKSHFISKFCTKTSRFRH